MNIYPQEIEAVLRDTPGVWDVAVVGAERLGRYKRPDAIHLIDSLPGSPTGKLLRRTLRDMIQRSQEPE